LKKQFNKDVEEAGGMEEFLNKNPIDDDTGDFAQGGRAGFKSGLSKALLEFMKKFKVKQSGDDVKDFLSKRQFMKDIVGNTKANEKARQLTMLKEMAEEYQKKKFGKFKFPSDEQIKIDLEKRIQPILNKSRKLNSDGGRIGLKDGMDRRTFLKIMSGLASIPILGKFLKPAKVASKTAPVAKEIIKQSSTPPPYFFELANTIKKFGKPDKVTYSDRVEIHRMLSKDGKSELQLTEDLSTGSMQIKKIKPEEDMVNEDIVLEFRKGDVDVDPEAGTAFKEADEYTEGREVTQRIYKDDYNEPDFYEGEGIKEIIDEIREAPSIKKAGGGIARMLGE